MEPSSLLWPTSPGGGRLISNLAGGWGVLKKMRETPGEQIYTCCLFFFKKKHHPAQIILWLIVRLRGIQKEVGRLSFNWLGKGKKKANPNNTKTRQKTIARKDLKIAREIVVPLEGFHTTVSK